MFLILFTICSWIVVVASDVTFNYGCKFEVIQETGLEILSENNKSVTISQNLTTEKYYAKIDTGKLFTVVCNDNIRTTVNPVTIQCVQGQYIKVSDELLQIDTLGCRTAKQLEFKDRAYRNGRCYNNYTNIDIELTNGETSYKLISVCHNEETSDTLFAKSIIRGQDLDDSEIIRRPGFKEGGFYPTISTDDCYTQLGQVQTLVKLLGSEDIVEEYIDRKQYITRGHLTPNADGIEGYEKRATFYFVNVVGQWQTINSGNWNRLEYTVRRIAQERQRNFTIYTGGFGITKLKDANENEVEIWLGKDRNGEPLKKLPVPHLIWKVIHDKAKKEAVAIITINNPYKEISEDDIICNDVCDELSWISWNTKNQRLGYTYCCGVGSFSKAVPYAPKLGNLKLLDETLEDEY